jgi:hypothetical protein
VLTFASIELGNLAVGDYREIKGKELKTLAMQLSPYLKEAR